MNPAYPSATGVREEIWRSLVSMLRVYASAATLSRSACTVKEVSPETVLLTSMDAELKLCFYPQSGDGSWRLRRDAEGESQGAFQVSVAGTLQLAGTEKQLDHAAVEWVEDLTRRAAHQQVS